MFNQAIILGRLGRDPELKHTGSGKAVVSFSVATTETWAKDGQKQERTEWHNVSAWGKLAEACGQYLHKGSLVFVEGSLRTRSYDDRDGVKRTVTEIVAKNVKFLDGKQSGERQSESPHSDDDVPF